MNYTLTTASSPTEEHAFKLWTLAYVVVFYFICVLVCIVLWYHLWVKNLGGKFTFPSRNLLLTDVCIVEIPIEKNVAGLDRRHLFYTTRSPTILMEFFKGMLQRFGRDYWAT